MGANRRARSLPAAAVMRPIPVGIQQPGQTDSRISGAARRRADAGDQRRRDVRIVEPRDAEDDASRREYRFLHSVQHEAGPDARPGRPGAGLVETPMRRWFTRRPSAFAQRQAQIIPHPQGGRLDQFAAVVRLLAALSPLNAGCGTENTKPPPGVSNRASACSSRSTIGTFINAMLHAAASNGVSLRRQQLRLVRGVDWPVVDAVGICAGTCPRQRQKAGADVNRDDPRSESGQPAAEHAVAARDSADAPARSRCQQSLTGRSDRTAAEARCPPSSARPGTPPWRPRWRALRPRGRSHPAARSIPSRCPLTGGLTRWRNRRTLRSRPLERVSPGAAL